MSRWIRIAFVLLVGLGLSLEAVAMDISIASADPVGHSHAGPEANCDDMHEAHGAAHGDHENHCCIAGAGSAAIFANAASYVFTFASVAEVCMHNDTGPAGPLYGIFRPPRDA